jgi:sarcosine oxidase
MPSVDTRFDVIVVGVGGMGSATLYHLARRGRRVLGIEQFGIPHDRGSSHGLTRIIRLAYFEHPAYVPLLRRAYALWRELSDTAGEPLLYTTGSLDIDASAGALFEGSRRACELHGLPYEILTGRQLHQRFPGFELPDETRAVLQPEGGYLLSERCIVAHASLAQRSGAKIVVGERVLGWEPRGQVVRVTTSRRTYETPRLVLTAGAWASKLVPTLDRLAVAERQVVGWFEPLVPALFAPDRFPVFNMRVHEGTFYGVPMAGLPGLKVGRWHHLGEMADPDQMDRACGTRDEEVLRACVGRYFPRASGRALALVACLFTNSPDEHFIIDLHPRCPQVSIAAGFSGHGYKFCTVVGEIMADLAESGDTRLDIGMFRLRRFADDANVTHTHTH